MRDVEKNKCLSKKIERSIKFQKEIDIYKFVWELHNKKRKNGFSRQLERNKRNILHFLFYSCNSIFWLLSIFFQQEMCINWNCRQAGSMGMGLASPYFSRIRKFKERDLVIDVCVSLTFTFFPITKKEEFCTDDERWIYKDENIVLP